MDKKTIIADYFKLKRRFWQQEQAQGKVNDRKRKCSYVMPEQDLRKLKTQPRAFSLLFLQYKLRTGERLSVAGVEGANNRIFT